MVIVTRRDLLPGAQFAQSVHAAQQFEKEHFDVQDEWYNKSNHLVLLSTENEESLKNLLLKARTRNIKTSAFTEPDMDNQLTAVTFEPGEDTCKLLSSLPLAFREYTKTFQQINGKEVASGN